MLDGAWYSKMLKIRCMYSLDAPKKGAWGFTTGKGSFLQEKEKGVHSSIPTGHIRIGRNPLKCDCSIKWIVEDQRMLNVIDWNDDPWEKPTCRNGTFVADLDLDILNALCP